MSKSSPLKRAVATEELVELTGGFWKAVILRQLLYWAVRCDELEALLREERQRFGASTGSTPEKGWIYKSSRELGEEIMTDLSPRTVRRRLNQLVEAGWVHERTPAGTTNRSTLYRPDLAKIEGDLQAIDHTLATVLGRDYPRVKSAFEASSPNRQSDEWNGHRDDCTRQGDGSTRHGDGSNTESTTETTPEINNTARGAEAVVVEDSGKDAQEATALLTGLGVTEGKARGLAGSHDLERVRLVCRHAQADKSNPAGWAVEALRDEYDLGAAAPEHLEDYAPEQVERFVALGAKRERFHKAGREGGTDVFKYVDPAPHHHSSSPTDD